ncbi:hypothetical protein BDV24DRAFT_137004 [Aspergillus arachidicola]|uniref:Uncharacterized protein n=1 Tax=Aspergillus arachidicola TaxID=656916 RepID=A0A5N6Y0S4_9EURO|nr:hypothetical protein BDV24DRAFT_137004 [Aspergillus arachidicola]
MFGFVLGKFEPHPMYLPILLSSTIFFFSLFLPLGFKLKSHTFFSCQICLRNCTVLSYSIKPSNVSFRNTSNDKDSNRWTNQQRKNSCCEPATWSADQN